jgi:hypothetical protein
LTRIFPSPPFVTPNVAGCPFAVFGGAEDALELLPPPPQPARAKDVSSNAPAPAR